MASYVQNVLSRDETITYQAKISIWSLAPLILLGLVTLMMWVGVLFFIAAYLKYISTELAITDKRVIAKFGFISRQTVEIKLSKVESMQIKQGILGRIFNYGSLVVAGAGTPYAPIPGISDPLTFRKKFMETQENAEAAAKVAA